MRAQGVVLSIAKFSRLHRIFLNVRHTNMSTFVAKVSPVTGKIDWIVQDDNYDFHQEVAR